MRRLMVTSLAVAAVGLMASPAWAFGHRRHHDSCCEPACCAPSCAPAVQVSYVDKTVTCYRAEWREREESYTVNRVVSRTEVVPQKVTVCVPVWREEKRTCTVYERVPREVVREVTCCRMVPVCVTDPCSCCTHTCWRPETVVQRVKCTVYDCVPRQQEYTVKVCSMKEETRTIQTHRVVCELKPETVKNKVRYCVTVPYQTTVKVAVCTPVCAPACATECAPTCCP